MRVRVRIFVSLFAGLVFLSAQALGVQYYINSASGNDVTGDGSILKPWKTLSRLPVLWPDDQVFLATGSTFPALTVSHSGSSGHPIMFDSYGSGPPPIIGDGTADSVRISSQSYIVIQHCDLRGKAAFTDTTGIVLANNLIRNSTGPGVQVISSVVELYNNTIVNNVGGGVVMSDGAQPANLTAMNNMIVGNGWQVGSHGVTISPAGRFTYDNNVISGNGLPVPVGSFPSIAAIDSWNISPACAAPQCVDGGHNLIDVLPGFQSWANGNAYFSLTIDGDYYTPTYWQHIADILPPGVPFTIFATHISLIPPNQYQYIGQVAAAGHEVAVHGWSHSPLDASTAIRISTTNASPSVVVDPVAKRLALNTTTPGNAVTIDWSLGDKDIAALKLAINPSYIAYSNSNTSGKGWTIEGGVGNTIKDDMRLKALAATSSSVFPYSLPVDRAAFYNEEIADVVTWLQAQTGIAPTTMAYPIGSFYNAPGMPEYLRDTAGFSGTRDSTVGDSWLGSVQIYQTQGWTLYHMKGDGSDATLQRVARREYVRCKMAGLICTYIWHSPSDIADAPLLAFVNEMTRLGGTFSTYRDVVDGIRADHTTVNGLLFTKTYPDQGNYALQPGSVAINAGATLDSAYKLALSPTGGTVDQATLGSGWEIGAYAFLPVQPSMSVAAVPSSVLVEQTVTLTATVTGAAGTPQPTGTVTFTSGSYNSGPVAVGSGAASVGLPASALALGSNIVAAAYSGDSSYAGASGSSTVTVTAPPAAVSVTPNTGGGTTQTFAFVYSDPAGYARLSILNANFNTSQSFAAGCATYYFPATNTLQLVADGGSGYVGSAVLGVAGTLQNSQCSIDTGASSASGTGNNLTVNLAITFKPAFTGTKNIYLQARNKAGLSSGWQLRGSWTPAPALPPAAVSVTPNTGSGTTQTFAFVYSDPAGYARLSILNANFNTSQSFAAGCATYYFPATNTLQLVADGGSGYVGSAVLGVAGTLQNGQCSIDTGASSASGTGNNLTVNLAITFKPAFTGTKNIYLQARNKAGLSSGWQLRGSWTPAPALPPAAVSVTPNTGSGTTQTFAFVYSDPAGYARLSILNANFNTSQSFAAGCATYYFPATNTLQLVADGGSGYVGSAVLGVAGTLQNGQCSIDMGASSASGTGNNLTVNLAITFKPTFTGTKNIYLQARNKAGLSSGWQLRGSWTPAPALPPAAVSVTPNAGTGASQMFAFLYSDPAGYAKLSILNANFNTSQSFAAGCATYYFPATNTLQLVADGGSGYVGSAVLGVAGTLQNSQCSIDMGASSASGTGNNLTVNLAITFKPAFTGTKNIYLQARNKAGLSSGWQLRGSWTP